MTMKTKMAMEMGEFANVGIFENGNEIPKMEILENENGELIFEFPNFTPGEISMFAFQRFPFSQIPHFHFHFISPRIPRGGHRFR